MARVKTQNYSGVNNFDADLGSVAFSGTTGTVDITTNLTTIVGVSLKAATATTDAGSVVITSPSLTNGEYKVVAGKITVTRSVTSVSGETLFYNLIGY